MSVGLSSLSRQCHNDSIYIGQALGSGRDIAMALIRIHLLLLLFAVSLSHVRPYPAEGEYFAASCTKSCGNDRPLTGQSDHPLCTFTVVPRTLDKWLGWVIILEQAFKLGACLLL